MWNPGNVDARIDVPGRSDVRVNLHGGLVAEELTTCINKLIGYNIGLQAYQRPGGK